MEGSGGKVKESNERLGEGLERRPCPQWERQAQQHLLLLSRINPFYLLPEINNVHRNESTSPC